MESSWELRGKGQEGGGSEEWDRKEVSPSPGVGGLDFGGTKKDQM